MVYIYSLKDPRDGVVKYIGQTRHIGTRLSSHISAAYGNPRKGRSAKDDWLRGLEASGSMAIVEVLEECDDDNAGTSEKKWIAFYRENGELFNIQGGSESHANLREGWVSTHVPMTKDERQACNEKARLTGLSYAVWARMRLVDASR